MTWVDRKAQSSINRAKIAILDFSAVGVKQKEIVQHYSMPQSTAANIIRRSKEKDGNNELEKCGRKKILSPRSVRALLKCGRKNKFKSLRSITKAFNQEHDKRISMSTARRILYENRMHNYVVAAKPFLSPLNKQKRMKWARVHESWTETQ